MEGGSIYLAKISKLQPGHHKRKLTIISKAREILTRNFLVKGRGQECL
jgi:hypothetical protein